MKVTQIVALIVSASCVAGGAPPLCAGTGALVAREQNPETRQQVSATSALSISGTVLREDRKTPVADVRLQLRSIDTGTIVGRTASDKNGAFSFAVSEPGLYVVEAVRDDGGVVAVGDQITLVRSSLSTLVILSSGAGAAVIATAALILTAAAAAGITGWLSGGGVASPER